MSVATQQTDWFDEFTRPRTLALVGIGVGVAGYFAAKNIEATALNDIQLTTEQALSMFGLLAGVGGASSQLVAAQRLSAVERETVGANELIVPLAITIAASTGASFFLPTQ